MTGITDPYYSRPEVSNSDLTALKNMLHPRIANSTEAAFRNGILVDALVTEPTKVDFYRHTVDGVKYNEDEWLYGKEQEKALRLHSMHDPFLSMVLREADSQRCMSNAGQEFEYGGFRFALDTRCKWDWWLDCARFGGDLKTTYASTQAEFEEAFDFMDIDRSRAWYMDIAGSDQDFVYAISKRSFRIFQVMIRRGDAMYMRGVEKYSELAFQWWCLNLDLTD